MNYFDNFKDSYIFLSLSLLICFTMGIWCIHMRILFSKNKFDLKLFWINKNIYLFNIFFFTFIIQFGVILTIILIIALEHFRRNLVNSLHNIIIKKILQFFSVSTHKQWISIVLFPRLGNGSHPGYMMTDFL